MGKVKTLEDLRKLREGLKTKTSLRDKSENAENLVQIKVAMATCCIASGSRDTLNYLPTSSIKETFKRLSHKPDAWDIAMLNRQLKYPFPEKSL
jgi:hypothetical protein